MIAVWMLACRPDPETRPTPVTEETGPTGTPAPSHTGATGTTGTPGTTEVERATNVLLVLLDDVSPDHVGAYHESDAEVRTPRIDALAERGLLFRNAWGYPLCSPARVALETGRHARRTGAGANHHVDDPPWTLAPDETSLPELLARGDRSWSTALVGKWHIEEPRTPWPDAKLEGWGFYAGSEANLSYPPVAGGPDGTYFDYKKRTDDGATHVETHYATSDEVDDALTQVAAMAEPWLLHVAFHASHEPAHVPPADLAHTDGLTADSPPQDLVLAMLEATDTELGRLLDGIDPEVLARTLIVVTADNGEPDDVTDAGGEGKGSVEDSGVRVPLVVAGPGVTVGTSDSLVSLVDLFPTIADLAGVDVSTLPKPIDGHSLLPVLADPTATVNDSLWAERFVPCGDGPHEKDLRGLRDARWKLEVDAIAGTEHFREYAPGSAAPGPDLLEAGALTAEQQAARQRLRQEMDARMSAMEQDRSWP